MNGLGWCLEISITSLWGSSPPKVVETPLEKSAADPSVSNVVSWNIKNLYPPVN